MRYLKYYTIIICFLLNYTQSNAQTTFYGKIDKFEILPEYLVDGKIKINNEAYTEIKYKVGFVREFRTITPPTWMPFNVTVRLSTATDKGDIILFDSPHNITIANFKKNNVFLDTVLTGRIDNSKVNKSRSIILSYIRDNQSFPNMGFEGKSYFVEKDESPITPEPDPIFDVDSVPIYTMRYKTGTYLLSPNPNHPNGITNRGINFYAFQKRVKGSRLIYGYKETYVNGTGYSYSYVPEKSYTSDGRYDAFYAFDHQVKGTVPVYAYRTLSRKIHYYGTIKENGGGQEYLGIAFYAYPDPAKPITPDGPRPLRPKPIVNKFTIEPSQWFSTEGGKFSAILSNIIQHKDILEVQFFEIQAGLKPGGPRGDYMETINLPGSFKNSEFSYELFNGEVVISAKNINGTPPTENINLMIQYLDGSTQ